MLLELYGWVRDDGSLKNSLDRHPDLRRTGLRTPGVGNDSLILAVEDDA